MGGRILRRNRRFIRRRFPSSPTQPDPSASDSSISDDVHVLRPQHLAVPDVRADSPASDDVRVLRPRHLVVPPIRFMDEYS